MTIKRIALLLTVLGSINWGLIGAFKFNLIKVAFGFAPAAIPVVQIILGVAAVYTLFVYMVK